MRVELFIPRLTGFTPGTDLFINSMPTAVTEGTALLPALPGSMLDYETPDWFKNDKFQLLCRSARVQTAQANAARALAALTIKTPTLLTAAAAGLPGEQDMLVRYSRPMTLPIVFPRQASSIWEVSINFQVTYALESSS